MQGSVDHWKYDAPSTDDMDFRVVSTSAAYQRDYRPVTRGTITYSRGLARYIVKTSESSHL